LSRLPVPARTSRSKTKTGSCLHALSITCRLPLFTQNFRNRTGRLLAFCLNSRCSRERLPETKQMGPADYSHRVSTSGFRANFREPDKQDRRLACVLPRLPVFAQTTGTGQIGPADCSRFVSTSGVRAKSRFRPTRPKPYSQTHGFRAKAKGPHLKTKGSLLKRKGPTWRRLIPTLSEHPRKQTSYTREHEKRKTERSIEGKLDFQGLVTRPISGRGIVFSPFRPDSGPVDSLRDIGLSSGIGPASY
jgi:hypothetical protein